MNDREIKNAIVNTMLHKGLTGSHKAQRQTVVGWAVASHDEGRAKELLDELIRAGVLEAYGGGHRGNVRLSSVDEAVQYLRDNGGDVPFGYD